MALVDFNEQEGTQFPGNSTNQHIKNSVVKIEKQEAKDSERAKRVTKKISGNAIQKKKSFGRKLLDTFIGEDIENVGDYVIHDVVVPAVKNTVSDLVIGSLDMMLFGERRTRNTTRGTRATGHSYTSYASHYSNTNARPTHTRRTKDIDSIILPTKQDAEAIISELIDLTVDYGQATVADLYSMTGITTNVQDHKFGWTNLSAADSRRVREGYMLILPEVEAL